MKKTCSLKSNLSYSVVVKLETVKIIKHPLDRTSCDTNYINFTLKTD